MKKPKRILCAVLALLMLLGAAAFITRRAARRRCRVCPTGLCSQDRG